MGDQNDKRNQSGGFFGRVNDEFAVRSATSGVGWDVGDVQPFFPCYIGVDDQLFIQTAEDYAGAAVNVNIRILGLDGLIHPLQFLHTPGGGRGLSGIRVNLMEGWLLSCTVAAVVGANPGQILYTTVSLVRAPFGQQQQYEVLVAGYVNNGIGLSYPMSTLQRPTDGNGFMISFNQAAPAAGADLITVIAAGYRWRLVSYRATLTTAVAVANRDVSLVLDDSANIFAESPSNLVLAASSANTYNWFDSATLLGTPFNGRTVAPLPSMCYLRHGFRISTQTTGIQAADQWSSAQMLVYAWFDDQ